VQGTIRVATEGLAQGQTMMNRRDFLTYPQPGWEQSQPLTQACMQVDAPQCLQVFYNTLMANWL
jgi:inosine-uridine nucleoside N-ribohydrolase